MKKEATVSKQALKKIIKEEVERSQRLPSIELIEDILLEAEENLKFVQSELPAYLAESRKRGVPVRVVRDDLAALNECLMMMRAILEAGKGGDNG